MGIQLDLLDLINGPNPAEELLHMPPGTLPPVLTTTTGTIYHVPDVMGKDRILVHKATPVHVKAEDTIPSRWIWTDRMDTAHQMLAP